MITFEALLGPEPTPKRAFYGRTLHRFAEHTEACKEVAGGDVTEYCGHDDLPAETEEEAELISSLVWPAVSNQHAPVIDIDLPCRLVESASPGHFHLYLDTYVEWDKYLAMLEAMAEAGVVQPGYVEAARRRGYTSVRHPNKPKQ